MKNIHFEFYQLLMIGHFEDFILVFYIVYLLLMIKTLMSMEAVIVHLSTYHS